MNQRRGAERFVDTGVGDGMTAVAPGGETAREQGKEEEEAAVVPVESEKMGVSAKNGRREATSVSKQR